MRARGHVCVEILGAEDINYMTTKCKKLHRQFITLQKTSYTSFSKSLARVRQVRLLW